MEKYREELIKCYEKFREENPLEFIQEQFDRVEQDLYTPRKGIASDEFVEFRLWSKGLKSRQEYFAEFIERILPVSRYKKLLEVGAGRNMRLSKILAEKGYEMTAMDPRLEEEIVKDELVRDKSEKEASSGKIEGKIERFEFGKTNISEYDGIIGQEPCDATEHIVRACIQEKKSFVVSLCGAPHRYINGEMPKDVEEWYSYLEEAAGKDCILIEPSLIPGYISKVLLARFD